jgi:glycosyltransferase involved in cell wall biosynthesis
MTEHEKNSRYGVVAIGRNEGERLKRCIASASASELIVYVDSGSTDDSVAWARSRDVEVVELDMTKKFTAARARNAGLTRLTELRPHLEYVQFVDGDCELVSDWPRHATDFLNKEKEVCAVFGRRRERSPQRSIYNSICDREWDVPIGNALSFGGDVMLRISAALAVGGYRNDLIAGEEPELSVRLRRAGWSIWRIGEEMTLHDAEITRFRQWWLRNVRSGYAFAHGNYLHGSSPERLWVWENRRALIWALGIPSLSALTALLSGTPALLLLLIYPIQLLRRTPRFSGPLYRRFQFAFFELLGRFPECFGQLRFTRDRLLGTAGHIIEYK